MKKLQGHSERLQRENDQLRAQIEKSHDLRKDVHDNDLVMHPIARNRGKDPIIPDDVNTPADDELSLGIPNFESLIGKGCSRKHKGKIAQKAFASPCLQ